MRDVPYDSVCAMKPNYYSIIIFALLSASCQCSMTVEEAGIKIVFPPGHRSRVINWAMADFGVPKYGAVCTAQHIVPLAWTMSGNVGGRMVDQIIHMSRWHSISLYCKSRPSSKILKGLNPKSTNGRPGASHGSRRYHAWGTY